VKLKLLAPRQVIAPKCEFTGQVFVEDVLTLVEDDEANHEYIICILVIHL